MKVLFISDVDPGPTVGGGPRRTHQILHELKVIYGDENVRSLCVRDIFNSRGGSESRLGRYFSRATSMVTNPLQICSADRYSTRSYSRNDLKCYRKVIETLDDGDLCVLEGFGVAGLAECNASYGFKTLVAPWAIESLTANLEGMTTAFKGIHSHHSTRAGRMYLRSTFTSLANEFIALSGITKTCLLSRLENDFLQAAGLSSGYAPYYPIGEAEQSLHEIRNSRRVERGLFLICGGANAQNRMALEAFLRNLRPQDVPKRSSIAIVGLEKLPEDWWSHVRGSVRFLGRLPQAEFDELLSRTQAVLIPQLVGFGCMTRTADMLCAGIPVVADSIVANATGKLPGVVYVPKTADGWRIVLHAAVESAQVASAEEYESWLADQRASVRTELTGV